jgi:hypothetical protein
MTEEVMNIEFTINNKDFPLLFQINETNINNIINNIIKIGYNTLFPQKKNLINNNDIIQKIDSLKYEFNNPELIDKISSLELSLNKLIGISSNSMKKGELAENILETIFNKRYGDIIYKKTNNIAHSGDAWIYLDDNKIIMLESKNYTTVVNKDEITKMENDMITNHIKWGIFISWNSNIQGMKEMDFYNFNHNNENYNIIMISNLSNDINKLDLGFQIVRKLILLYGDLNKFPWLVKNIKSDLNSLNEILQKNYLIRDNFYTMEKEIHKSLFNHHIKLRDYQYEIETKINSIIKKISTTIDESIELNNIDNNSFIDLCNEKLKSIGQRIIDIFNKKELKIVTDNSNIIFYKNENDFCGNIKIQTKKIIIDFTCFDLILNFSIGKEKEITFNLNLIENFIL